MGTGESSLGGKAAGA